MNGGNSAMISHMMRRRLIIAATVVCSMIVVGAAGFRYFERYTLLESIYISAQTVTTVGYGDIAPVSSGGRVFSILLMLTGVGTVLYALTTMAQAVVQSEMIEAFGLRRKLKEMDKLAGHYIVCGSGRVGRRIIGNLKQQGLPFVIIESDEDRLADFQNDGSLYIVGDATSEDNLKKAGVERAHGLASCLADDASNVYVVLTARGLNPGLHIVARAVEEQAEATLIRAGASRVVAPTIIGSQSMARALLKPAIADFMDSIVAETLDLVFEEIAVDGVSNYADKRLDATGVFSETIVVAIRRRNGRLEFHPKGDELVSDGDLLLVIGKAEAVRALKSV